MMFRIIIETKTLSRIMNEETNSNRMKWMLPHR